MQGERNKPKGVNRDWDGSYTDYYRVYGQYLHKGRVSGPIFLCVVRLLRAHHERKSLEPTHNPSPSPAHPEREAVEGSH